MIIDVERMKLTEVTERETREYLIQYCLVHLTRSIRAHKDGDSVFQSAPGPVYVW